MPEFKDKIPAAGGSVEYLYDPQWGIAPRISGTGFRAIYQVALSVDGKHLLATVPAGGIGSTSIYPQPSVLAFVQSDEQGMWGRNCPTCEKYFRTNHIIGATTCPYCYEIAPDLAFVSKEQLSYLTACYDAFARAYLHKKSTSVDMADITDEKIAWHYSEVKQQFHFVCQINGCKCQTDILGQYGYCPRCGLSNARTVFFQTVDKELARLEEVRSAVSDRHEREKIWEKMTVDAVSQFEALGKHLRRRLLRLPLTSNRRRELQNLNFQQPIDADRLLKQWFDIGTLEWVGTANNPKRQVADPELPFIKVMVQKRHILIHNGGVVDQEYLDRTGDTTLQIDERIRVKSKEARRFLALIRDMARNLMDNVEEGFSQEQTV
jgi:thiol-disulfide isomerase/thioredoxin